MAELIPFRRADEETASAGEARSAALEQVMADVRHRWGYGSIVRLDGAGSPGEARPRSPEGRDSAARRARRRIEVPPWWPQPAYGGTMVRPRLLELAGAPGSGRLTLALTWMAAAQPALAAVVDVGGELAEGRTTNDEGRTTKRYTTDNTFVVRRSSFVGQGRFYPPAAVGAGLDAKRFVVIRPPAGEPRAPLDAVAVLLRSEAFDVVLCPLPAGTRIGLTFGSKLATLAARSGTTLLLLSPAAGGQRQQASALAAFADYRVRLAARRWMWLDGELAGMRLRVMTERARVARTGAGESAGDGALGLEHELTLRLHRSVRDGGQGIDRGNRGNAPDLLRLEKIVRIERAAPVVPAAPSVALSSAGERSLAIL
ncbi:MAG: hypothetical protein HY332_07160 [Chloroflexi bacterium]|nr:hypothetical protein [Chloroflexota bacterium]